MVRKIVEKVSEEQLHKDLEKYRQRALELGATDAKIITTDMVVIDERVRAKCNVPFCTYFGTNANCPPNEMGLDLVRKIVNNFQYAIFFTIRVPSEEMANTEARSKRLPGPAHMKNYEIVSKIESAAFYDGYHLAVGFAGGPCKRIFCFDKECSALTPGQPCRHALRARPAMEGVGMDAFTMAAKVGWDVYPIGWVLEPSDVPCGTRLGMVLIY